jgi:hypothetical protein
VLFACHASCVPAPTLGVFPVQSLCRVCNTQHTIYYILHSAACCMINIPFQTTYCMGNAQITYYTLRTTCRIPHTTTSNRSRLHLLCTSNDTQLTADSYFLQTLWATHATYFKLDIWAALCAPRKGFAGNVFEPGLFEVCNCRQFQLFRAINTYHGIAYLLIIASQGLRSVQPRKGRGLEGARST